MTVDPAVFTCVSMLAKAVGPMIAKDVKDLLENMLAVGLRLVQDIMLYINLSVFNKKHKFKCIIFQLAIKWILHQCLWLELVVTLCIDSGNIYCCG